MQNDSNQTAFSDYLVFVDESGDHSLESINAEYPVFVLAFCILPKLQYIQNIAPAVRRLKCDLFGHDLVILHEHEIRKRKGAFSSLSKDRREALLLELNEVIADAPMTLVAVAINKIKHKAKYNNPRHPYYLAMQYGLERVFQFIRLNGQQSRTTHVICEARGAKEDRELELEFRRVCDGESRPGQAYNFDIIFADKKSNSEGLQLADLVARPIGLQVLRPNQENRAWNILETKFFKGATGATIHGNGFKVFP
jgi:Protein of unknown function (DUF3800)